MKKSLSSSSLNSLGSSQISISIMRKSISTNALPFHNIENLPNSIEMVMFTNYPINKIASCSIDNNRFPDQLLNITNKNDLMYVECIATPSDIPEEPIEKIRLSSLQQSSRNYLELSMINNEEQKKYIKWLSRIRRKNKN